MLLPTALETAHLTTPASTTEVQKKKRKGPKGPNPLSVKKKLKQPVTTPRAVPNKDTNIASTVGEKRKRPNNDNPPSLDTAADSGHKRKRRRKNASAMIKAGGGEDGED